MALVSTSAVYPARPPFHPSKRYPELSQFDVGVEPGNQVYTAVRDSWRLLGMDAPRFGTPAWNPLGELVSPGARVLLKPNFVGHKNHGDGPLEAVVTHGSVVRAITDYVLIALQGSGELVIGDAPQMNCDFPTLCAGNGMDGVAEYLERTCKKMGVSFRLQDFRQEQTWYWNGIVWKRKKLRDASAGTVQVTLGRESFMDEIDTARLYGADYDRHQTIKAHENHQHSYLVTKEALDANVVISIPKLKVHSKVGTTLNIKNMVGINTDKNHLAHYRIGSPAEGGDEFSNPLWDDRLDRRLSDLLLAKHWSMGKFPFMAWRYFRRAYRKLATGSKGAFSFGNWHGNDTAWRMALDLNRILLTADSQGRICSTPQRGYLSLIDGIVGGQGNGPLSPDAYPSGVLIAGRNPLATDWIATLCMGFTPERVPMYARGFSQMREWIPELAASDFKVVCNVPQWTDSLSHGRSVFNFSPSPGWVGSIENVRIESKVGGKTGPHQLPNLRSAPDAGYD